MARWILTLAIFFLGATGLAANTCSPYDSQFALTHLDQLQNHTCEEVKNSQECQQVYSQIKTEGGDPKDYELQCKDRGQLMRALENYANIQAGCALGGWNFVKDTFVGLGTAIGEGVAKMVVDAQQEKADNEKCDKDPKLKKSIYTNYNSTVPKMLQVEVPADEVFGRVPCAQLKAGLRMMQTRQGFVAMDKVRSRITDPKAKFSPEEKEYVDWIKKMNSRESNGPSAVELAKKKIHELGVKYECYNTLRATAMICEGMLSVATVAAGGVGIAAKVARIAGVASKAEKVAAASNLAKAGEAERAVQSTGKVEELVSKVQAADRRGAGGAGQALTNQAQKEEILNIAGSMTNQERVSAFEGITGRKLTVDEANQLQKMHEIGTSEGRTYSTLTKKDLEAKAKLASEINPATGKAYFTKEETNILMRNGITGWSEADKLKAYTKYADLAAKNDYSQYYRLHAESSRALGKTTEAEAAYKKAYAAYVKESKVDFSNSTAARQKLSSMSERDLGELENLSAFSGNTEKLADVTKAKWNAIERDIRSQRQYRNGPGASQVMESTVHASYQELQTAARSSDPMIKKAAEEKIKAMKVAFPGLK